MTNTTVDSRPLRVIVIEDDAHLRAALDQKFTKDGFAVTLCENGVAGLAALRQELFNAIVLDLKMPEKSGIDVLRELPDTENAQTPVFVLTAQAERCDEASELGARRCYLKMEHRLRDVVDSICEEVRSA